MVINAGCVKTCLRFKNQGPIGVNVFLEGSHIQLCWVSMIQDVNQTKGCRLNIMMQSIRNRQKTLFQFKNSALKDIEYRF